MRFLIALHQPRPSSGDYFANAKALVALVDEAAGRSQLAGGIPAVVFAPNFALEGPQGAASLSLPAFSKARAQALAEVTAAAKRTGVAVAMPITAAAGSVHARTAPIVISGGAVRPAGAAGEPIFEGLERPEEGPMLRLCETDRKSRCEPGTILWQWHRADEPFAAAESVELVEGGLFIRTNLAGGEGEHVYRGASCVAAPGVERRAARYEPDALFVEACFENGKIRLSGEAQCLNTAPMALPADEKLAGIIAAIRDYTAASGAQGVVLGISGGIDSALLAACAVEALGPERVTGFGLASRYTSEESRRLAASLAQNLGLEHFSVRSIEAMHELALKDYAEDLGELAVGEIADQNIQARLRAMRLMAYANKFNRLLLCTSNKGEAAMGYGTLYGDIAGGFAPIVDLWKREVVEACRAFNAWKGREVIPEALITRAPTAELRPNQKDSDSLPPYDEIERAVSACMAGEDLSGDEPARTIVSRAALFAFKRRQAPAGLILSENPLSCFDALMGLNRKVRWPQA